MGKYVTRTASFAIPANQAAYAAGDEVSTNVTAGSTTRATFDMTEMQNGRVLGAGLDIAAASGSVVITSADFELLIFRTHEVPAAVGNDVTNPIASSDRRKAVAEFRFDDGAWINQLGAQAAGTSVIQNAPAQASLGLATPRLQEVYEHAGVFNFDGAPLTSQSFTAVLRALSAWNPASIVNTFSVTLDLEV